jgi:hypothetical protein
MFGLEFVMSLEGLTLSLKSDQPLPVEEKRKREQLRSKLLSPDGKADQMGAPLLYPRDRRWLKMGMLDYNINQTFSTTGRQTLGLLNVGMEALGGDMVGSVRVNNTSSGTAVDVRGLRWRYVLPGAMEPSRNVALTALSAGDIFTTGQSKTGWLETLTKKSIQPPFKLERLSCILLIRAILPANSALTSQTCLPGNRSSVPSYWNGCILGTTALPLRELRFSEASH